MCRRDESPGPRARAVLVLLPLLLGVQSGPARYVAVQELRIDGERANLVPVHWLGWSHGRLAVLQRQDQAIRLFDAQGRDAGSVGGPGSGPGQFRSLATAGWLADTLWTWDARLRRLTYFSVDGRTLATLPITTFTWGPAASEIQMRGLVTAVRRDGKLVVDALMPRPASTRDGDLFVRAFVLADDGGGVERIIAEQPPDPSVLRLTHDGRVDEVRIPFVARTVTTVANDGSRVAIITASNASSANPHFLVTAVRASGDTAFRRQIRFEPEAVTRAQADSALNRLLARPVSVDVRRALTTEGRSRIPPVHAPVAAAFFSADNRLWIGLRPGRREARWLVLGAAGELVGQMSVSPRILLQAADSAYVWGLERNSVDVESIVRLRYRRSPGR